MVKIFCLLTMLFGLSFLYSQINMNKSDFEVTFENEMNEKKETENKSIWDDTNSNRPLVFSLKPDVLPNWFFKFSKTYKDTLYAIGISDPFVSAHDGNIQAKERSISLLSLMEGTYIKGISESYTKNISNKFEEMFKCKNDSKLIGKINVIDSFSTKFGERILLVQYVKCKSDTVCVNVALEQYKAISKIEYGYVKLINIDFNSKNISNNLIYNYTQNGQDFLISSMFNNQTFEIPQTMYEYTGDTHKISVDSTREVTIRLAHKGLWAGFIKSFTDNLSILASNKNPEMKTFGQYSDKSNEKTNNQILQRNILNKHLVFKISQIEIIDNELNIVFY